MSMENSISHSHLVVKSNALINAMFDMGLQEMRFLAFAISQLPRGLEPLKGTPVDLEIDVSALAEAFEIDPKNAYHETKALADRLMKKIIEFESDGRQIGVGLLSKREYHIGEGRLLLRFDEDLIPHLIGLKENFTKYRIKDVYQFKRASTWRMYELLKQFKEVGKREFELEELKFKLGVGGLYSRLSDFKRRIIDTAIEDINVTSDILVTFDQKKRGRRVVKLIFHIRQNEDTMTRMEKLRKQTDKITAKTPPPNPEFAKRLREEFGLVQLRADQIAKLAATASEASLKHAEAILARAKKDHEAGKIKSLGGYVFTVLKNEFIQERVTISSG